MPGINGLELIERINELYPDIINIILTAHTEKSYVSKAYELNAYGFLQKPIDREILISKVRSGLLQFNHTKSIEFAVEDYVLSKRKRFKICFS